MNYIQIYRGEELIDTIDSISDYAVLEYYALYAYADGTASGTVVKGGGTLTVDGGTVTDTTIRNNGTMTVCSGIVSGIDVWAGGSLVLNGDASDISLASGSSLSVAAGGSADKVSVSINAQVAVAAGGALEASTQRGGSILLDGGTARDIQLYAGTFTVGEGAVATGLTQRQQGTVLTVLSGGRLEGTVSIGAAITLEAGAVASDSVLTGYLKAETGEMFRSSLTLAAGAIHRGTLSIAEDYGVLTAEAGAVIDFTVAGCDPNGDALIDNFAGIAGTPAFSLTVSPGQASGDYLLADGVSSFAEAITVGDTLGNSLGTLNLQQALTTSDATYTLSLAERKLSLTIAGADVPPSDLAGDAHGISWKGTAGHFDIQYSQDDFAHVLALDTDGLAVDTYALPAGVYQWRVKHADGETWSTGGDIVSSGSGTAASSRISEANGSSDLFFANPVGTWNGDYQAQHVGSLQGWEGGTGEIVELNGRNRILDTFTGSDDASILVLTDDANGDALFVDDIYSDFPDGEQARMARLDEIRAGAGDDLVDMTSQRFAWQGGGVLMRGGDGNDTLWAAGGDNILLGDAGRDRLVGSSGNDVLAGGSGNDSLHGGGGADIFCFCENWGDDTVEQLAGEGNSVVLWFRENAEDLSLTFRTDGSNTVITAASGDTITAIGLSLDGTNCRFGGGQPALTVSADSWEYSRLVASGAFEAVSSTCIFMEA